MKRLFLLGWIGLALAAGTVAMAASLAPAVRPHPPSLVPPAEARVATPLDTLRHRVAAGDDLIVTLPATHADRIVASYALVRAPSLSWLVDRSLLWRTRTEDAGTHALRVEAAFADAPPDTLTILVDVTD